MHTSHRVSLLRSLLCVVGAFLCAMMSGCCGGTPAATGSELQVRIEAITPIRALRYEDYDLEYVSLSDARALDGVEGIVDRGPGHAILLTVHNPMDSAVLLSSWGFDQMFIHDMTLSTSEGDMWRLFNTWEHVSLGNPVYRVPLAAHSTKRWVYVVWLSRLGPADGRANQAVRLPSMLSYAFKDGATIKAKVVRDGSLSREIDVRVVGRGRARVSPDGSGT